MSQIPNFHLWEFDPIIPTKIIVKALFHYNGYIMVLFSFIYPICPI
jgi:hypothetical protein